MTEACGTHRTARRSQDRASSPLSRRAFFENVAVAVGGLLCPGLISAENIAEEHEKKARVVIVQNPSVVSGRKINAGVAEDMVNRAMCLLTAKESPTAAWKSLFSSKERVAIKVNTRHPPVAGNREITDAIVKGLKDAGIEENRIIIFDFLDHELTRCRYELNDSSKGVRCYGIRECREMAAGPVKVRVSKILMDEADAIINVPAFRHHVMAGVTISMKNHLGSIQNPRDLHRDNCLYIADLNALDAIRKKTRLIIADGILGQYNGGPSYRPEFAWEYTGVIAATDTVAVDAVAAEEILLQRHKRGMEGPTQPTIKHIPRAAELGLGIADLKNVNVVREVA